MTLRTRFEEKLVKRPSGCWSLTGARNVFGYTIIWDPNRGARGTMRLGHRVAYELLVGPIPENVEIDHLCRVRDCVNPLHLDLVTHQVNVKRGANVGRRKLHCPQGHPYDEENTYLSPSGKRSCRTCTRDAVRRYHEKHPHTICPQGHAIEGDNAVQGGKGMRCLRCLREQGRRLGQANRGRKRHQPVGESAISTGGGKLP